MHTTAATPRPATQRQLDYIRSLVTALHGEDNAPEAYLALIEDEPLTTRTASKLIDTLKRDTQAKRDQDRTQRAEVRVLQEARAAVEGLTPGAYNRDGTLIRVYRARGGDHLLAKALIDGTWEYQGAASRFVRASQKLTLEAAAAYGIATGICACCGKTLTHPDSIAAGIGPVCRRQYA